MFNFPPAAFDHAGVGDTPSARTLATGYHRTTMRIEITGLCPSTDRPGLAHRYGHALDRHAPSRWDSPVRKNRSNLSLVPTDPSLWLRIGPEKTSRHAVRRDRRRRPWRRPSGRSALRTHLGYLPVS